MATEARSQENYLVPHDLGALEAKACHQTLLIEGEGVDAAVQGVGGWVNNTRDWEIGTDPSVVIVDKRTARSFMFL